MAPKSKGSSKAAEASHSAGNWSVRFKAGHLEHVDDAFMRRNADHSYTFTRDGRVVLDAPPGEVSFVRRHEEPVHVPLPDRFITSPASVAEFQDALCKATGRDVVLVVPDEERAASAAAPAGDTALVVRPGKH